MLWSAFALAIDSIRRNGVRSILTALGIVIGVASVIAMVNLGQAATQNVTAQISSMGPNLLYVRPGVDRRGPGGTRGAATPFTIDDSNAIANEVSGVLVAPGATAGATAVYGNVNHTTSIIGTNAAFLDIRGWELAGGRSFEPREESSGAAVCLLGNTVVTELFAREEPLGKSLRVGKTTCQVVGLLASKGSSMGNDEDDIILMPTKAVQTRLAGNRDVGTIYVSAIVDGTTQRVQSDIEALLRQRRGTGRGKPDDFNVRNMQEVADTLESTTKTMTSLLAAIAAVSLLVGGIGIMNIMLVSVTERTREIGIRLAIGARGREVLTQFLVEATSLSLLGGAIGVAIGIGGTWLATHQLGMPFVVSVPTVVLAFVVSALIGMVFGFVPARKAARLNPIDALRHE